MAAHCAPGAPMAIGEGAVVLVGNPNVGKSVVFNALTGTYVDVSNFPGTTVELTHGRFGDIDVLDTPGVYGVSSFNDEETVARDVILFAGTIVNVVDAVHLERDLFLTLQLADMGLPMVVALNMADEARSAGVAIDRDLLEDLLGVPVIETVAVQGKGIAELKAALRHARPGHPDPELLVPLDEALGVVHNRAEALLLLEGDEAVAERHGVEPGTMRDEIYTRRRARVDDLAGHVVREEIRGASFKAKLSMWMMHPLTGIPMLIALLGAMYIVIGQWIAGNVVGFLQGTLFEGYWYPFVQGLVGHVFASRSPLFELFAGQFGVLTMTPAALLGIIFPLVTGFYFLLSLLEDTGYLPRIAALADRSLNSMGLNGRAVIPLILGLGCVTMGTLTTRILGSRRERFIATTLMAIAVPCSAQLGIVAALMATTPPIYTAAYFLILLAVFVALGTALNKLVPGQSTDLLIDLPTLRLPRLDNIAKKTGIKVWNFMREVALFFIGGTFVLGVLKVSGGLDAIIRVSKPLISGWLGLPPETATAFVMGLIRRDFGAAGFMSMHLNAPQLLVAMVTITLFVPCMASALVVLKERGWRYLIGLFAGSLGSAFLLGGIVHQVIRLFGGMR
jgi:ferrous iron transport protein B